MASLEDPFNKELQNSCAKLEAKGVLLSTHIGSCKNMLDGMLKSSSSKANKSREEIELTLEPSKESKLASAVNSTQSNMRETNPTRIIERILAFVKENPQFDTFAGSANKLKHVKEFLDVFERTMKMRVPGFLGFLTENNPEGLPLLYAIQALNGRFPNDESIFRDAKSYDGLVKALFSQHMHGSGGAISSPPCRIPAPRRWSTSGS